MKRDEWLSQARAVIAQMRADMEAEPDNNQEFWLPWCQQMEALSDNELLAWLDTGNPDVDLFVPENQQGELQRRVWAVVNFGAHGETEGTA